MITKLFICVKLLNNFVLISATSSDFCIFPRNKAKIDTFLHIYNIHYHSGISQSMNNSVEPPTDIFSTPFLLGSVGAPFIIGMAVGYFAKKMLKIALLIAGAAIVLLFVSEYYGIVQINDAGLQHAADVATDAAKSSSHFLVTRLSSITSKGVSAAVGFFAGLKLG
jgi:uncharacterized membrane protein (Fun14 family)